MTTLKRISFPALLVTFAVAAHGQAIVEYGLGVGRSGAAGAAAGKKTGAAAASVLNKATAAVEKAGTASAAQAAKPAEKVETAVAQPALAAEPSTPATPAAVDPASITAGMERQDLIAKLGKPSMKVTKLEDGHVVEKYWYKGAGRETVLVTLRNGKVESVSPPPVLP